MILYFTGTGNSRFAAQTIARVCDDELVSMNDIMRSRADGTSDAQYSFASDKPFVFVCPTYCWSIPRVVQRFLRESSFSGCKTAYFYLTCGDGTGAANQVAAQLCDELGFEFRGLSSVCMPENYIAMFDSPDYDEAVGIINAAVGQIESAARLISLSREIEDPNSKKVPVKFSEKFVDLFYRRYVTDKKFKVDTDKCVGCGKCESVCPLGNIKLSDNHPIWQGSCTQCMGCIGICPTDAIDYGARSAKRRRYYLFENGRQKN